MTTPAGPRSRSAQRLLALLCALVCLLSGDRAARAQVADLELSSSVFHEPSAVSAMTVLAPSARLSVSPWEFLSINAGWEADIVSGATEPVKAGPLSSPDIISQATMDDTRHVLSGGFTITKDNTQLSAGYSYGAESDYRSQAITVSAGTDFLQRNTQIVLAYARGFDEVCNVQFSPALDPSVRPRLDSSEGCFGGANRQTHDVSVDNFQVGWTQSWTPVFSTQLVLTGSVQHGFLGNPYRGVVIGAGGQIAQEHHPENRARGAVALRGKYYVRPLETAFGLGVRAYRDTWDIISQTYELEVERYMLEWLRLQVRGRFYTQTEALFWSDDYTGGEPEFGPRGQYWSGDREMSPFNSYSLGGRILASWKGETGNRIAGMFLDFYALGSLDLVKTDLQDFTLAGVDPDDTLAVVLTLGLGAAF